MTARGVCGALALAAGIALGACFGDTFGDYARAPADGAGGRGHDVSGGGGAIGAAGTASAIGGAAATAGAGGASGSSAAAGASATGGASAGGAGGDATAGASGAAAAGGPTSFCAGKSTWPCDPVSDAPCGVVGSACDIDVGKAAFACFKPPNALSLGAPCKLTGPDFCQQGATCLNGACARFCCDDGPCSGLGTCQAGNLPGVTIGLCGCDPSVPAALGPTLKNLAQQYAPGAAAEGAAICGSIAEGKPLARAIGLMPGRCYTAIGVADTSAIDLVLTLTTLAPMGMPGTTLATSGMPGPAPVLGAEPGCFKPTSAVDAVFTITSKKGAASVMAQLYSK